MILQKKKKFSIYIKLLPLLKVKLGKMKRLTEIAPYTSIELMINMRTETAKRTQALSKKTKMEL